MDDVAVVAPRFFFTPSTLTAHFGASGAVLRQHVDPTSLGCQSPIAIADVDGDGIRDQPGQRTFTEDVIINENELVGSAEIGAVVGQPFLVGGPGRVMELDAAGGPRARPP